ncbi:hypothetical protein M5K25_021552 [Dendrobium thyrsiflorum]|uniref:Aminotransferase-like plant mobile domain-containing protein n=1 Tax=Dendrobium thyrsiflorum TaxID=117978 RepID=A0ABD0UK01_DENTH
MFDWKRHPLLQKIEPTEESIWQEIDKYDFSQSASISDRLYWHREMLVDRDIYDGIFTRSPCMSHFDLDLPTGHDPVDWIITVRLRHSDGTSLERIVEGLNYGDQDILQPAADVAEHTGAIRLLSYQLLHHEIKEQHYDPMFGSPIQALTGYVMWARYTLQMHQKVLKQAGIYEAIYISLFDYSRLSSSWLQSIIEHWDRATNTCWVGPNEMTITLWDLYTISGLPILGVPYEEYVPADYDLFSRRPAGQQRRGEFVYSDGLHQNLRHYYDLYQHRRRGRSRRGTVSLDVWIASFLHPSALVAEFGRIQDPFNKRSHDIEQCSEDLFESGLADGSQPVFVRGFSDDMLLVSFIATWLCYFVFPSQSRVFRPSTLLMASLIASGRRVSLAPAVLAQIYHSLGQICTTYGRAQCSVEIPWHYLHGWIHIHVAGAFSCPELPSYYTEHCFPSLVQLARATSSTDRAQIRLFMFAPLLMIDPYRLIYRSPLGSLPPQCFGVPLVDSRSERGTPTLLSRSGYILIATYLISMRPGWVCYRRHGSVILEGYNPNRAARQFGLVQATPLDGLPVVPGIVDTRQLGSLPLSVRLEAASMTWAFLLRLGTGSRFYIPQMDASTGVSHLRLSWIRHTFSSFFEMGIRAYSRRIRGQRPSRYPSVPYGHTTVHHETFKADDRRRKRSPEPIFRHRSPCMVHRDRPISPFADRGHPRRRASDDVAGYNLFLYKNFYSDFHNVFSILIAVSKHIPADQSSSPILESDTLRTPPGFSFPFFLPYQDTTSSPVRDVEPIDAEPEPTLSILGVGNHLTMEYTLDDTEGKRPSSPQLADSDCTQMFEDVVDSTVTDLAISYSPFSDSSWVIVGDPPENTSPGLELSFFVSRSVFRARLSSSRWWSRGVQYAVTALRALLLRVDLDALPDLSSFHMETSLLLDFAASCGLHDDILLTWETFCRTVEFGLFQLLYTSERLSCIVLTDLETEARVTWDRMRRGRLDLDFGLQTLQCCQRDISEEQIMLLGIEAELRALRQRERALLVRRQEIRAVATRTEEDFSSIAIDVEHLEDRLSFFTKDFDSAHRQLEFAEEQRTMLQDRLNRVSD